MIVETGPKDLLRVAAAIRANRPRHPVAAAARSRHLGIEILHDCRNGTKGSPARRCSHTRKPPEGYTCLHAGEDDISASSADMPAAAA